MTRLLPVIFVAAAVHAAEPIAVEQRDPDVKTKRFDPAKPPPELHKLGADEQAYCAYYFHIDSRMTYTLRPRGEARVVTIDSAVITLNLDITLWLPEKCPPLLETHEHGHRRISQAFYDRAKAAATQAARGAVGQSIEVQGDAEQAAKKFAEDQADAIARRYLDAIQKPCVEAQDKFDQLTDHGRKRVPTTDQAVEMVLKRSEVVK